ncbi:uncharacterized protein LOC112345147 [Selaginella moellendorffii]|uniref:uncharacterized protein LOC112345147 n=1 Tax=Selaginella moellendorffii TaxID=88036 RepID=UPI000D1C3206|nr:uncharacterized protein LOC112345147 [Selaginella moellendorffii]|eukprot:XP_024527096.1 uncharacterized protein LOC112345147 [Selaginella moellendorffii]
MRKGRENRFPGSCIARGAAVEDSDGVVDGCVSREGRDQQGGERGIGKEWDLIEEELRLVELAALKAIDQRYRVLDPSFGPEPASGSWSCSRASSTAAWPRRSFLQVPQGPVFRHLQRGAQSMRLHLSAAWNQTKIKLLDPG